MKYLISTILLLTLIRPIQAQSIDAADGLDTVKVMLDNALDEIKIPFKATNVSQDPVSVHLHRSKNELVSGHETAFCWDICWGPATSSSATPVEIQPGDTTLPEIRYLIYQYDATEGTSVVNIRFYNVADSTDFEEVVYEFVKDNSVSIDPALNLASVISGPYPNPVSHMTQIQYRLKAGTQEAYIQLYNLIGKPLQRVRLDGMRGKVDLDMHAFPSGIYFIYLMVDGQKITARKMVVSH